MDPMLRPARFLPLALLASLAMGVGCDRKGKTEPAAAPAPEMKPVAPVDPSHIPDYSTWRSLGPVRPSHAGPHRGSFQRIFLNPVAARAMDEKVFDPWPDGSQLVKEALDAQRKRLMFFWMSREQGQWVWATGDPLGKVATRFPGESSGSCAACHMARTAQFGGAFSPVFAGKGTLPDFPSP